MLHAAQQALDEDVIDPPALAIHADADAMPFEDAGEVLAGQLAALTTCMDM